VYVALRPGTHRSSRRPVFGLIYTSVHLLVSSSPCVVSASLDGIATSWSDCRYNMCHCALSFSCRHKSLTSLYYPEENRIYHLSVAVATDIFRMYFYRRFFKIACLKRIVVCESPLKNLLPEF
jgi:hypothetical protein